MKEEDLLRLCGQGKSLEGRVSENETRKMRSFIANWETRACVKVLLRDYLTYSWN